jgi:hypothetical protein
MRKPGLTTSLCVALTFAITNVSSSRAQISHDIIKIGVMADMNGPLSSAGGRGSVEAARMAADEFGGSIGDKHIEIVSADHQNKPDIGAAIARQWFNVEHVDVITDLANSAVGFAVVEIAKPLACCSRVKFSEIDWVQVFMPPSGASSCFRHLRADMVKAVSTDADGK